MVQRMRITFQSFNITSDQGVFDNLIQRVPLKARTILAIQEISEDSWKKHRFIPNYIHGSIDNSLGFIISSDILAMAKLQTQTCKKFLRMFVTCSRKDGSIVKMEICNFHGNAMGSKTSDIQYAKHLGVVLGLISEKEHLIMGDFNRMPFDYLVASNSGWRAKWHRSDVDSAYKNRYSLFWSHLKEKNGPKGTFYYDKNDALSKWEILDQMILSKTLMKSSEIKTTSILKRYCGIDCEARVLAIKKKHHLPITMTMEV